MSNDNSRDKKIIGLPGQEIERRLQQKRFEKEQAISKKFADLQQEYEDIFGKKIDFHHPKQHNASVNFAQMILKNIRFLTKINYITTAEYAVIIKVLPFLEFGTNALIKVEDDIFNKAKKKMHSIEDDFNPKRSPSATINYLATEFNMNRGHLSEIFNSLFDKGIMATAGTGKKDRFNRVVTARTWLLNPSIAYFGDKQDVSELTKRIFQDCALYNIKIDSKKMKLPIIID